MLGGMIASQRSMAEVTGHYGVSPLVADLVNRHVLLRKSRFFISHYVHAQSALLRGIPSPLAELLASLAFKSSKMSPSA